MTDWLLLVLMFLLKSSLSRRFLRILGVYPSGIGIGKIFLNLGEVEMSWSYCKSIGVIALLLSRCFVTLYSNYSLFTLGSLSMCLLQISMAFSLPQRY